MPNGAVILAAGISSRMGEFKPLLPMGEETVIQHVIRVLRDGGAGRILVVTGYQSEALRERLAHAGVIFVHNERFAQTRMFDSVRLGLCALGDECEKILLTPADVPLVQPATVHALLAQSGECVLPLYQGRPGHPLLLARAAVPRLLACSGEEGLRGAIREAGLAVREVEVEDEGAVLDMDTPQDYEALLRRQGGRRIRVKNQLVLGTDTLYQSTASLTV